MNIWQKLSQLCVFLLIVIAACVTVLLILEKPAWLVIIAYWLVLTVKNLCDWLALRKK